MSQSAKGNSPQEASANPRRGRARGAGDDALGHAGLALSRAGFSNPTLVLRWPEIAGAEVARIAAPVKFQPGNDGAVLTLKCDPGAAVFLQHQTRPLIERLNAYLGGHRIARIKFLPGRLSDWDEPPPHPALRRAAVRPPEGGEKPRLSGALERLAATRRQAGSGRATRRPD